jgi:dipeptidase
MDLNGLFGLAGTAVAGIGTVVWWMFRSVHARAESNEKDLAAFKLHCAETYVTSSALEKAIDRFSMSIDAVFKKLERIEERLDHKADKA